MKTEAMMKIANIKGLCGLCFDLKVKAMQAPTADLTMQIIKDYDGFQCNAIRYMKRIAYGEDKG